MAKKKAQRKTAGRKTAHKKVSKKTATRTTTKKNASRKKVAKKTAATGNADLSRYSQAQLEAALTHKRSSAIDALKGKRADLMKRVRELDAQIKRLGGGSQAPGGELAAAVLRELRRERKPKQLLESCSHLIGGSNKGAILGQKLMALKDQGKVRSIKRGVWAAK